MTCAWVTDSPKFLPAAATTVVIRAWHDYSLAISCCINTDSSCGVVLTNGMGFRFLSKEATRSHRAPRHFLRPCYLDFKKSFDGQ